METTTKTAKEIFYEVQANPARKRFGFGKKAVLVNIDPQKAYTRTDLFKTAYETDPNQMEHINTLARKFRA
ncbi:MAG: maleamate amidohydrolase, partial [Gammaproteobacteria bacterium]